MFNKFFTSFLTLFCFLTPTNNIRYSSQSITFDKSDVVADLESDSSFNFNDYKKNEEVKDEDAIKDITLINSSNSLYLYLFNQNGKSLESNLKNVRASISFEQNYTDTSYYLGSLVSKSDDNLFYKFRFDYSISNIEQVHIADIEFDYGEGYALGRHNTIGSSYYYEKGKANAFEKKELEVIDLPVEVSSYRFNYLNDNTHGQCQHFNDLFYLTFTLPVNYGDLVGIKMSWDEINKDILTSHQWAINTGFTETIIDESNSDSKIMEFSSSDFQELKGLDDLNSSVWDGFTKLINLFNKSSSEVPELKVIEKIDYDFGANSKFENYYFSEDTISSLNQQYYTNLGSHKSSYVIRFAIKDFSKGTNGNSGSTQGWIDHDVKTTIENCDVLTLTFLEDGKTYTLMASSKPVDYDPGNEIPDREDPDWLAKFKQLLSTILLVVLICVSFPIIVNIIIPICKLTFMVITLPFKAISKAVKKKKKKNKKE